MIECYANNQPLRARYIELNNLKHCEAWETESGRYRVALCSADFIGIEDSPEFSTIEECAEWCKQFAPELPFKNSNPE